MREEEPNWFSKWDEELPSPEELTPLSQTLITPDLALAFDIPPNPNPNPNSPTTTTTPPHHHPPPPPIPQSSDFGSPELTSGAGAGTPSGGADEPARTLKRPRLVWTPQLHKRFVDAVAHLGIKNAVPKTIMQLMSVDGLTRENVASHLQKYRLYLKRMQGLSAGGGGAGGAGAGAAGVDAATDHLFGSTPVPHHFLHPGRPASDHFLYAPVAAALHHQQQMAAAAVAAAAQQQQYQQQQRQVGQFGSPPGGQFEHPLLSRQQAQPVHHRMAAPSGHQPPAAAYVEDLESATGGSGGGGGGGGGRKVLTLFPTGDD